MSGFDNNVQRVGYYAESYEPRNSSLLDTWQRARQTYTKPHVVIEATSGVIISISELYYLCEYYQGHHNIRSNTGGVFPKG